VDTKSDTKTSLTGKCPCESKLGNAGTSFSILLQGSILGQHSYKWQADPEWRGSAACTENIIAHASRCPSTSKHSTGTQTETARSNSPAKAFSAAKGSTPDSVDAG